VLGSISSGLVVDDPRFSKTPGEVMQQYNSNGGTNQSWTLTNLGDNIVSFVNVSSDLALEVAGGSASDSALVDQNAYVASPSQQWHIVHVGNGSYEIINLHSSQALDVDREGKTAGIQIDQFLQSRKRLAAMEHFA
jgi:Ricin-type beta-trefoil lectin domain-like